MAKKNKKESPDIHEELSGFDIQINRFGQMESNFDIDKINKFLNKNIDDKKLSTNSNEEE